MALNVEQQVMVEKILKLIELGKEGNDSEAQRAAANAKAAELMAKYSIDFADLRSGKKEGLFERFDINMDKDPVEWEGSLANVIAFAFDVTVVQRTNPAWVLMYCGTKTDVEISIYFFRYLKRAIGLHASRFSHRKADQKTFAYGSVMVIGDRLKELYQKRNEMMPSDSKALMVIKQDGLQKFVEQQFPNLRKGRPINLTGSRDAHEAGKDLGRRMNLTRPIGTSSSAQTKQIG